MLDIGSQLKPLPGPRTVATLPLAVMTEPCKSGLRKTGKRAPYITMHPG
jgi:hypothetical protein